MFAVSLSLFTFPLGVIDRLRSVAFPRRLLYNFSYTFVDSRYLEVQETFRSTSRYSYLDISDVQN